MKETHLCEICRRSTALTYHRGLDQYICDACWDELPTQGQSKDEAVDDL